MSSISDNELLKLILESDNQLLEEDFPPNERYNRVPELVTENLGINTGWLGRNTHPIFGRVCEIYRLLYRKKDIKNDGFFSGIFMIRDVFGKIEIPIIFGKVGINPYEFVDFNENQIRWLDQSEEHKFFIDQFADLFDSGYGLMELRDQKSIPDLTLTYWDKARYQLEAAVATLTGTGFFDGALQSAHLVAELTMKGALLTLGASESDLKSKFKHNLTKIAEELNKNLPDFEGHRVLATVKNFPDYVQYRYATEKYERKETGHVVMGAQYIMSEVIRQFSDRRFRKSESLAEPFPERSYPPLK